MTWLALILACLLAGCTMQDWQPPPVGPPDWEALTKGQPPGFVLTEACKEAALLPPTPAHPDGHFPNLECMASQPNLSESGKGKVIGHMIGGLEKYLADKIEMYRKNAFKLDAMGFNGDAVRRQCEGDFRVVAETPLQADLSAWPHELADRLAVSFRETTLRFMPQCWW